MGGGGCYRKDWEHSKAETWRVDRKRGESEKRSILVAYVHYCFVFPMKMRMVGEGGDY